MVREVVEPQRDAALNEETRPNPSSKPPTPELLQPSLPPVPTLEPISNAIEETVVPLHVQPQAQAPVRSKLKGSQKERRRHPIEAVDKPKLEKILANAPKRKSSTLEALCKYFQKQVLNEDEKAWLAFRWLGLNIVYNVEGYFSHQLGDNSPEGVFRTGTSVCEGYAALGKHIISALGLEVVKVSGWAKGVGYNPEVQEENTNHAWNAIRLHDRWELMDSTWGGGSLMEGKYMPKYEEYYFCTDPTTLISSHFPQDSKWQLLDPPMSREEFERTLKLRPLFYSLGFSTATPDNAVVKGSGPIVFQLECANVSQAEVSAKLICLENNSTKTIENATFVQRCDDHFEIQVALCAVGKYDLTIFGSQTGADTSSLMCEYRLICEEEKEFVPYPYQYAAYHRYNTVLHSPKMGRLEMGTTVHFKIAVSGTNDVAVIVGSNWNHLQTEGTSGIFEGDVEIDNNSVHVNVKNPQEDSYTSLLVYQVRGTRDKIPVERDMNVLNKNGITDYPKNGELNASANNTVQLIITCKEPGKTLFLATLKNSSDVKVQERTFVQMDKEKAYVDASLPGPGTYKLELYAKSAADEATSYSFALRYTVKSKIKKPSGKYPTTYSVFSRLGCILYEPKEGVLAKGKSVQFRLRAPNCIKVTVSPISGTSTTLTQESAEPECFSGSVQVPKSGNLTVYAKQTDATTLDGLLQYEIH